MFGRKRSSDGYGIQILDRSIRLIGVRHASQRVRTHKHHTISLPEDIIKEGKIINEEALAHHLSDAVQFLSIKNSDVAITIPTSNTIIRRATFPVVKDKELRNLIDVELHGGGEQLPFKNPVFDFFRIGRIKETDPSSKKGQEEVLIFASPSDVIESYINVVTLAGLNPVAVDLAPLALFRVLLKYLNTKGRHLADSFILLNTESDHVEISIFINGYPVFLRSVPVRSNMYMDDEEDAMRMYHRNLSMELGRVMNYYKYSVATNIDQEIKELYIVGDSQWTENIAPNIEEVFMGKIEQIQVNDIVQHPENEFNTYVVPIGLALRGV